MPEAEQPIAREAAAGAGESVRADQGGGRALALAAGGTVARTLQPDRRRPGARTSHCPPSLASSRHRAARRRTGAAGRQSRSAPRLRARRATPARGFAVLVERGERGEVYNVATGIARSIAEVLEACSSASPASTRRRARSIRRASAPADIRWLCGRRQPASRASAGRPRRDSRPARLGELWARDGRSRRGAGDEGSGHRRHRFPRAGARWTRLAREHALRLLVRPSASRERFPERRRVRRGRRHRPHESARAPRRAATRSSTPRRWSRSWPPTPSSTASTSAGSRTCSRRRSDAGVARIVYVSSFIALGPTERGPGRRARRDAPRWPADRRLDQRLRAHQDARRTARPAAAIEAGAPLRVVYPGVIYGPGELTEGNIVVRHILDLVHEASCRRCSASRSGAWNYVFVEDVADGDRRAPRERAGRRALRARRRERHARPSSIDWSGAGHGSAMPTLADARLAGQDEPARR